MGLANLDGCAIMINAVNNLYYCQGTVTYMHRMPLDLHSYISSAISYPIVIILWYNNNNWLPANALRVKDVRRQTNTTSGLIFSSSDAVDMIFCNVPPIVGRIFCKLSYDVNCIHQLVNLLFNS